MTSRPAGEYASDLGTASVVLLCMSISAGVALVIEAVWLWVPWLLVAITLLTGTVLASRSRRALRSSAPDSTRDRRRSVKVSGSSRCLVPPLMLSRAPSTRRRQSSVQTVSPLSVPFPSSTGRTRSRLQRLAASLPESSRQALLSDSCAPRDIPARKHGLTAHAGTVCIALRPRVP